MDIVLRFLHIGFGELTLLFTMGVVAALIWGSQNRKVLIAKIASLAGALSAILSWVISGTYYVVFYGPDVKPTIKSGPWPWAHSIFMESKEHVFLFLPFLAVFLLFLVWKYGNKWEEERYIRISILTVGAVTILIPLLMMFSGYLVSTGYRIGAP